MSENEHIFFSDLKFPGQYYGVLIRSPVRHGKLLNILPPELPDGYFLYTAADIPGKNYLEINGATLPVFAPYELNYLGEPVGILVGPEYETAVDLAERVEIQTDGMDADEFPEGISAAEIIAKTLPAQDRRQRNKIPFNVAAQIRGKKEHADAKNTEAGKKEKPEESVVIESTADIAPQNYFYTEPLGAVARPKKNCLEIYTATQWPFHVRKTISLLLDCAPETVIVAPTEIGETLDGKIWLPSLVAAQTALAAYLCKKPVKLVFSRDEDFLYTLKSAPAKITYRTIATQDGSIQSMRADILFDTGAYSPFLSEIVARAAITAQGFYAAEKQETNVLAVRTNTPPMGAINGFGDSSVFFALENHMNLAAQKLGLLPDEFKMRNAADEKSAQVISAVCGAAAFRRKYTAYEYLNKTRVRIDDGPVRGIGLAWGYQGNGFATADFDDGQYAVEMTMETNGEVHIKTGFYSASMKGILSTIAAETFEIEKKLIVFTGSDTTDMSSSGPDTLSSKVAILAPLVSKCCASIQRQRFRKPLPITVKKTYRPPKNAQEKEAETGGQIQDTFLSKTPGACVVELELDTLNYDVKIRSIWISCSAGRLFNRHAAENTIKKTLREALSKITAESIGIEDGKFRAKDGIFFGILPSPNIPDPKIIFIESREIAGGIGSVAYNLLPGAYAAALAQITRRAVPRIPVSSEYVYNCMEETKEDEGESET